MSRDHYEPSELSRYYREEDGDAELSRRRAQVALNLVGVAAGAVVGAYQTGLIGHLPDPPSGGLFDSDKVDASDYAYKRAETPDGLLMLVTYSISTLLAGAGGPDRARRHPWLSLLNTAKCAYDLATAAKLAREEWGDNKALCAYCQSATAASVGALALSLPEAAEALGHLTSRD